MNYLNSTLQIVPIGITNSGKTTFINSLVACPGLLNTSEMRETSCLWKIQFQSNPNEGEVYRFNVFTIGKDMKTNREDTVIVKSRKELKDEIRKYSEKMRKDSEGLIDKINVRLPLALKDKLFPHSDKKEDIGHFQIIDMPGQEDSLFLDRIQQYISYH